MITKVDKAIVAFILGAAGSLGTSAQTGDVDTATVITALVVGIVAAVGVWAIPNKAAA